MRIVLLFIFGCILQSAFGQMQSPLAFDTLNNDSIVLLYDSLPEFTYFNPANISAHTSRIATFKKSSSFNYQFFLITLLFSMALTTLVVLFKPLVKATFKSAVDANFSYQYIRMQKNNNVLPYLLFSVVFAVAVSLYFYYGFQKTYNYTYFLLGVIAFLLYDVLINYIFILFTRKNIKDHLLYSTLSYYLISALFLWPFFLLIHVNLPTLSLYSFFTFIVIIIVLSFFKLWRLLNVLNQEKVKITSFHFFIYLCTFKIAPILLLISFLF